MEHKETNSIHHVLFSKLPKLDTGHIHALCFYLENFRFPSRNQTCMGICTSFSPNKTKPSVLAEKFKTPTWQRLLLGEFFLGGGMPVYFPTTCCPTPGFQEESRKSSPHLPKIGITLVWGRQGKQLLLLFP